MSITQNYPVAVVNLVIVKSPASIQCSHCQLPVPTGLLNPENENQFCCTGCQAAFQLIHDGGLDAFYGMASREASDISLKDRVTGDHQFVEFDTEDFLDSFSSSHLDGERQITLSVDGMHCAACIWLIEKLPTIATGVTDTRVNWSRAQVRIRWKPEQVSLSVIATKLYQLGYTPHPVRENDRLKRFQVENRRQLARIGVAAALAGNNMILALALYIGLFSGMSANITLLIRIASCLIGVAALLIPGRVFLSSALNAIRTRTPHMDLPIALALCVGTAAGFANVVRGTGEIYFDSLSVLICLLLIGRWLQFKQQSRAADAVEMLFRLTPRTTRKFENGESTQTLVDLIRPGDTLEICVGELIPSDGELIEGGSHIDESVLTGESAPVRKSVGDTVAAGTTNKGSTFLMKVNAVGDDTRLAKIVDLVEQTSATKPIVVQWANKIGGYFVTIVILLAVFTLFYWLPVSLEVAIDRTIALLIVACPCALALATPLAISVAIGRAARNGIMIKSGDVLQSIQQPGMIWLDKTGTLTEGNPRVVRWYGSTSYQSLIQVIENKSLHPIARALVEFTNKSDPALRSCYRWNRQQPISVNEHVGMGMHGRFEHLELLVGNDKLLRKYDITPSSVQKRLADANIAKGFSIVWVAANCKVVAMVSLEDSIRDDTENSIELIRERGWKIGILSGDHQSIVERVARRLRVESQYAIGEASPERKMEIVSDSQHHGNVIMVGDGVNDSAALAAATVGLAVKNGAESSLAAAPVYLAKPGLNPILEWMDLCESSNKTMRRNLGISLSYNVLFASAAFFGLVNPLVAAILMPISSLTVVSLSFSAGHTNRKEYSQ